MLPFLLVPDHRLLKIPSSDIYKLPLACFTICLFDVKTCQANIDMFIFESLWSKMDPLHVKMNLYSSLTDPSLIK